MIEAIRDYLPWLLSAITIWMTLLAGNKHPRAWQVGLSNQAHREAREYSKPAGMVQVSLSETSKMVDLICRLSNALAAGKATHGF